jgi:hypothetical protein
LGSDSLYQAKVNQAPSQKQARLGILAGQGIHEKYFPALQLPDEFDILLVAEVEGASFKEGLFHARHMNENLAGTQPKRGGIMKIRIQLRTPRQERARQTIEALTQQRSHSLVKRSSIQVRR